MPSPSPVLARLNASERDAFRALGGVLPSGLGPPPASEWRRLRILPALAFERPPEPLAGAELCLLSEATPAALTPAQWEALSEYRAAVRREGVPRLTAGDRERSALFVVRTPRRDMLPKNAVRVVMGDRSWLSMTAAAKALGVSRWAVRVMMGRRALTVPAPPPETPRERGRRAAAAFVRALDEAA